MSKTIPADGRTKVLSESQVEDDEWTIRNVEGGGDAEIYPSGTEEDGSLPLPAGSEVIIKRNTGWFPSATTDGAWVETTGNRTTELVIVGAAITRNERRTVDRPEDRAGRTGDVQQTDVYNEVAAGTRDNSFLLNVQNGKAYHGLRIDISQTDRGVSDTTTQDVQYIIQSKDSDGNLVDERVSNGPSFSTTNVFIPADGNITVAMDNFSGTEQGFFATMTYMEAP